MADTRGGAAARDSLSPYQLIGGCRVRRAVKALGLPRAVRARHVQTLNRAARADGATRIRAHAERRPSPCARWTRTGSPARSRRTSPHPRATWRCRCGSLTSPACRSVPTVLAPSHITVCARKLAVGSARRKNQKRVVLPMVLGRSNGRRRVCFLRIDHIFRARGEVPDVLSIEELS